MTPDSINIQNSEILEAELNMVSDAIIMIDENLKIIFQNESVNKLYGSRIDEQCFAAFQYYHLIQANKNHLLLWR